MPVPASIQDISSLISAGIGVAGLLASGLGFLWGRVELNNKRMKRELQKCEDREKNGREERGILTMIIELMWQEIETLSPGSKVLRRAQRHLDRLKTKVQVETDDLGGG